MQEFEENSTQSTQLPYNLPHTYICSIFPFVNHGKLSELPASTRVYSGKLSMQHIRMFYVYICSIFPTHTNVRLKQMFHTYKCSIYMKHTFVRYFSNIKVVNILCLFYEDLKFLLTFRLCCSCATVVNNLCCFYGEKFFQIFSKIPLTLFSNLCYNDYDCLFFFFFFDCYSFHCKLTTTFSAL